MAYYDAAWYLDYGNGTSTGYYSVAQWTATHAYAAGAAVRQLAAPAVGSERVFVCIIAGTSLGSEPAWVTTRGAKTAEAAGPTWMEMTGVAGLNGDTTNTPNWTAAKAGNASPSLGAMIQRNNGASYWVCTTAGTMGASEPAWANDTAGTTQADNTVTWTCLGVVGNWSAWQTPCPRLAILSSAVGWIVSAANVPNAIAGKCDVYVASEHAETQAAAMSFANFFGRFANGILARILCVTKTTVPPVSANLTTGASITTTGASSINAFVGGYYFMQGLTISAGSGAVTNNIVPGPNTAAYYKNCVFAKGGTTAGSIFNAGAGNIGIVLDNCQFQCGATGDTVIGFVAGNRILWKNTATPFIGGVTPTVPIWATTNSGDLTMEAIDFSALSANWIALNAATTVRFILRNCKVPSGTFAPLQQGAPYILGATLDVIRCDSGATNYRHERHTYMFDQTIETTIVRTGGATDGTTPISWKIVTGSALLYAMPSECMPIVIWNDITGTNRVVTVYGIWGGGAVPNNNDIWIDVEYPGSSTSPLSTIVSTAPADILAAGIGVGSDSSTWGGSTTPFKLTATLSSPQPAMKGPLLIIVKVAKASSTFYIDPQPVLS
jgi:hypothetical protein